MTILEVAVAAPVFKTYSYELPHDTQELFKTSPSQLVGCRVFVPFGNRKITGYVLGFDEGANSQRELKEIYELLDDAPLFHLEMVALFKWVANYYHYPIGRVIQTALPGGLTVQAQKIIRLSGKHNTSPLLEKRTGNDDFGWLRKLAKSGALTPRESRNVLNSSADRKLLMGLVESDIVSIAASRSRDLVRKKTETCYRLKARRRKTLQSI